jgi:hypothetical protein
MGLGSRLSFSMLVMSSSGGQPVSYFEQHLG